MYWINRWTTLLLDPCPFKIPYHNLCYLHNILLWSTCWSCEDTSNNQVWDLQPQLIKRRRKIIRKRTWHKSSLVIYQVWRIWSQAFPGLLSLYCCEFLLLLEIKFLGGPKSVSQISRKKWEKDALAYTGAMGCKPYVRRPPSTSKICGVSEISWARFCYQVLLTLSLVTTALGIGFPV